MRKPSRYFVRYRNSRHDDGVSEPDVLYSSRDAATIETAQRIAERTGGDIYERAGLAFDELTREWEWRERPA